MVGGTEAGQLRPGQQPRRPRRRRAPRGALDAQRPRALRAPLLRWRRRRSGSVEVLVGGRGGRHWPWWWCRVVVPTPQTVSAAVSGGAERCTRRVAAVRVAHTALAPAAASVGLGEGSDRRYRWLAALPAVVVVVGTSDPGDGLSGGGGRRRAVRSTGGGRARCTHRFGGGGDVVQARWRCPTGDIEVGRMVHGWRRWWALVPTCDPADGPGGGLRRQRAVRSTQGGRARCAHRF